MKTVINKPDELNVEFYKSTYTDLQHLTENELIRHYVDCGKIEKRLPNKDFIYKSLNDYKKVFSKYFLQIKIPSDSIPYDMIHEICIHKIKVLSIHCNDLTVFEDYFGMYYDKFASTHHIIITFSISNSKVEEILKQKIPSLSLLKIQDKGADIGNKLITMSYLHACGFRFKYCMFFHSKSCPVDRNNFIKPFYKNIDLIEGLIDNGIQLIVPNYHNIRINNDYNRGTISGMEEELQELFHFFNINTPISQIKFNGTNTFVLSYTYIMTLVPYLNLLYNNLNGDNDFDNQWYKLAYGSNKTIQENFSDYKANNHIGNCWKAKRDNLPLLNNNGSFEHLFERFWIMYSESKRFQYFSLPENVKDFFNIKIYPIYFPQFHNSKENNNLWGQGFTEWTLLKPFPEKVKIHDRELDIYKPHSDIGYYSLDHKETIQKQISIANEYNIDGFMIYHYWFNNNHSVLNRVEQHILEGNFQKPFYLCWANEPWTQQWEGGGDDKCFIKQEYEDEFNMEHIQYLLQLFKMDNYVKNSAGECLFYIYNYKDMEHVFSKIMNKWTKYLESHGISIKIITTANNVIYNQQNGSIAKHIFTPASASYLWEAKPATPLFSNEKIIKDIPWYIECDYLKLIEYYKKLSFEDHHICIPLFWNNIMRKKNKPHLQMKNFNPENLKTMVNVIISKILLRNQNKIVFEDIEKYNIKGLNNYEDLFLDNNITVNAWNEWNEQAILEPNHITGYENLETLKSCFE